MLMAETTFPRPHLRLAHCWVLPSRASAPARTRWSPVPCRRDLRVMIISTRRAALRPARWRTVARAGDTVGTASCRHSGAAHAADRLLLDQTAIADGSGSRYLFML